MSCRQTLAAADTDGQGRLADCGLASMKTSAAAYELQRAASRRWLPPDFRLLLDAVQDALCRSLAEGVRHSFDHMVDIFGHAVNNSPKSTICAKNSLRMTSG
jgi:hypothetical protein